MPSAAQKRQTRASAAVTAFGVDTALRRMSMFDLWPGFKPLDTPLAIYDGTTTTLFRHPSPPAGYRSLSSRRGVWARPGRDPAIVANSSATLGGVPTATVILNGNSGRSAQEWAALTIHELFHVFQRAKHPGWTANEVDLFTYPVDDTLALAFWRQETLVLRRLLRRPPWDDGRCQIQSFSLGRDWRLHQIGARAAAYERGTELNEGLAQYVELRALRRAVVLPFDDSLPERVRERAYATGAAIAQVLDRVGPDWRMMLETLGPTSSLPLDSLLARISSDEGRRIASCRQTIDGEGSSLSGAARDIRAMAARRARDRSDFLAQPGWQLRIESATAPLFPQGFDPLNVRPLGGTEVLHTRFVKLGNSVGSVSTFDRAALTEGVGPHPLFNGIRVVTIAGFDTPVAIRDSAGALLVRATGVHVQLRGARADTAGQMIRIRLP